MNIHLSPEITHKEFKSFRDLIFRIAGVHMNDSKIFLVRGRLMKRVRYYGFKSYKDYYNFLQDDSNEAREELPVLVDLLTTHETYFFREPEHFEFLRNFLQKNIDSLDHFSIWVAAASSGEEAYSVAMTIESAIGDRIPWKIYASDISQNMVETAKKGIYPMDRTKNISREYLKKYCRKGIAEMEGVFAISREIKKRVSFDVVNLTETHLPAEKFDVIFLRNVMIYFNQETKAKVVEKVIQRIKPGGFLVTGHSESLSIATRGLEWYAHAIYKRCE